MVTRMINSGGSNQSSSSNPTVDSGQTMKDTRDSSSIMTWVVLVVVLIVVALLAALWATYTFYPTYYPFGRVPYSGQSANDFQFFYVAKTVISTINIALLAFLLITYVGIYAKTRSQFTIGLIVFSIAFLIKDLTASPLVIYAFHYVIVGLGPFAFLPDLFEFVALMVLLYLSVRY
jgi:hypothetical protein